LFIVLQKSKINKLKEKQLKTNKARNFSYLAEKKGHAVKNKLFFPAFFIIVFVAFACRQADAQRRQWQQGGMEMSTGVNQFPVKLGGGSAFKPWEALSFNLMQRFYSPGGNGAMRAAIDFYILPATDYKYYVTGFGMGYAYYGDISFPRFRYFAGLDFRVQTEREEYRYYSKTDLRIGFLPNVGLQYRLSPRFSLSTEVSYFLALRQRRTDSTDPNSSTMNSNKFDLIGRQHRMLGLGVGFLF
jgi:hypothetical protein